MKYKFILPLKLQLFADEVETTTEEVTSEVTTNEENSQVVEDDANPQQDTVKPVQSKEDNSKFAAARREAEAKARQVEAENQRLLQVLNKSGYSGSALEIADIIEAQLSQRPVEQVRAEREAQEQQTAKEMQLQTEVEELRNYKYLKLIEQDIADINKAHPEAKLKSINDLDIDYLKIMRTGEVDSVTAYEILQARKAKEEIPKPQITGAVNSQTVQEKEIYTADEVRQMSSAEVSKNFEKIQRSMKTWKK